MQHVVCNGVPRTIGRTIRGTLSSGVKIIDVSGAKLELGAEITHIVHIQIDKEALPELRCQSFRERLSAA